MIISTFLAVITTEQLAAGFGVVSGLLLTGIAWGRIETKVKGHNERLKDVEDDVETITEKLNRIDKNTAVIAAWVEQLKDKN